MPPKNSDTNCLRDVSLVGFDNVPLCPYLDPPLSSVAIPMQGLGAAAMETLMKIIDGGGYDRMRWMSTELVLRESTCAPEC